MDAPTYDSPRCRGYVCRQWQQWHGTWFKSENINAASLMFLIFARSHTTNPRWCRWCHILWFDGIHCRWVVKYPWLGVKNYILTTGTCGMIDKKYIPHRPKICFDVYTKNHDNASFSGWYEYLGTAPYTLKKENASEIYRMGLEYNLILLHNGHFISRSVGISGKIEILRIYDHCV